MQNPLFDSLTLGALHLSNRIVMSPMTRDRAGPDDVPGAIMVDYYRQRAGAGLIVTEGVQPSAVGKGYWRTPESGPMRRLRDGARLPMPFMPKAGKS